VVAKHSYDHVYLDLNGLLHALGRNATNEVALFKRLFAQLDRLFKLIRARKTIFIAVDGPSALAKMMEQRRRRLDAVKTAKRKAATAQRSGGEDSAQQPIHSKRKARKRGGFNMLNLTPGTTFMERLKNSLAYWGYSRLQNDRKYINVEFVLSAGDSPGEGEMKIVAHINVGAASMCGWV
jgi:5'-3' exonuclease